MLANILNNHVAKVEAQLVLENKYNKKQKQHYLHELFSTVTEDYLQQKILAILLERPSIYINSVVEMLLERNNLEESKTEIVEAIQILIENKLVGIEIVGKDLKLVGYFTMPEEVIKRLKEFKTLLPMITQPLAVNSKSNNKGSGYLTVTNDSLILGNTYLNHHEDDICTEMLDAANSIAFKLNPTLIDYGRNSWKALEKPKQAETKEEMEKRIRNFVRYQFESYDSMKELYEHGNKFYFCHKYDKRGRMYPIGYHVSYQGNDFAKACLELAHTEIIEDTITF